MTVHAHASTGGKRCGGCKNLLTSMGVCPKCKILHGDRWEIVKEVPRQEIVNAARSAIGWPFRHQGKTEDGVDCVGLLFHVGISTGLVQNLNLPDYFWDMEYSRRPETHGPDAHWLLRELASTFIRNVGDPGLGDIIYCRNEEWVHLGIIGLDSEGDHTLIHAYANQVMKVVEHHYTVQWRAATAACFSWPGAV